MTNEKGIIESHIGVLDVQYKINRKHTIRAELQGLWTVNNKDRGEGNIVYSHNNYAPGDEYELYDKILELVESEDE